MLEEFTARIIEGDPDIFFGKWSPLPAGFEGVLLPLGLAYAKQGNAMPYLREVIRDGLKGGQLDRVRRCISGLGPVGFYYPMAVFQTLREANVDFRRNDIEEALVSAFATIRTLHIDEVDAFLDTVGAGDSLRRRVAANADTNTVRDYIFLLGFYNNAVHQALKYPKMRRGLLMHGLSLLADARNRREFLAPYATDALRMLRDAKYDLIQWTEKD
jgi:hypothetical protein